MRLGGGDEDGEGGHVVGAVPRSDVSDADAVVVADVAGEGSRR